MTTHTPTHVTCHNTSQ